MCCVIVCVIVCCVFCVFHICEDGGACVAFCVCSIYVKTVARVLRFLCVPYIVKTAARVLIIYVCAMAPCVSLICNYYNALYGAALRFRARNRYFKSILIDL